MDSDIFKVLSSSKIHTDKNDDSVDVQLRIFIDSFRKLKEETENLEIIKNQSIIMMKQYDHELNELISIKSRFKSIFKQKDETISSNNHTKCPSEQSSYVDSVNLSHTYIDYKVIHNSIQSAQNTIKLKYCLKVSNVVCSVAISSDGSCFAFSNGSTTYMMSTQDGALLAAFEMPISKRGLYSKNDSQTRALAFSPNNKFIAVAGPSNDISVFNTQTSYLISVFEDHEQTISSLVFIKSGSVMLSGSFDGSICGWDFHTFALCLKRSQSEKNAQSDNAIISISLPANESVIVVGYTTGVISIFDVMTVQPIESFKAHNHCLMDCAISHNGEYIVSASQDNSARLWNTFSKGYRKPLMTMNHDDFVLTACFSNDDIFVFTGSKDESIRAWDTNTKSLLFTINAHQNTLFKISHHPTEKTIITCSGDGLVAVFDY